MHIDRCLDAVGPERVTDHWPNGQIRHKVIVHDIEMHDVGTRVEHSFDVLTQASEIGRKY
jgi:hypothetical protein